VAASRKWFWLIYGAVLSVVTIACLEFAASYFVPTWPARDLRPVSAQALRTGLASAMTQWPQLIPDYNDWAMRDRPRSIERPSGIRFRSVIVGDSFVEGFFVSSPLPARMEYIWNDNGQTGMEAIDVGVSGTGPRQYYYRIRDFAIRLKPDVIVVVMCATNDFISAPFDSFALPPLIDELPMPSVLGSVAPRTTWLAVDRLGLSEIGRWNKNIPGEFSELNEWVHRPAPQRLDLIVRHMHRYYYPNLGEDMIRAILSRGDGRLWTAFEKRQIDPEFAVGWLFSSIIDWETGTWPVPRDPAEADKMNGTAMVEETLGWLVAADRTARENGVRLIVALAPTGAIDPAYAEFRQPWPRYFSYSWGADARQKHLAALLRQQEIPVIDLREVLSGRSGMYRLIDGHWTESGTQVVAERLARDLLPPFSARR
jgi:hypothetical protein